MPHPNRPPTPTRRRWQVRGPHLDVGDTTIAYPAVAAVAVVAATVAAVGLTTRWPALTVTGCVAVPIGFAASFHHHARHPARDLTPRQRHILHGTSLAALTVTAAGPVVLLAATAITRLVNHPDTIIRAVIISAAATLIYAAAQQRPADGD